MPLTVRVLFFVVFFIPLFVSGQSSIVFDGIDDHVSVADDPLFTLDTNNFTIECWVKFSSDPVNGVLIGQDEGSGEQNKWLFGFLGGDLYFHVNGPSTGIVNPLVYAWDPVIGTYYHLALTRSGSRFTLFINGTETASNLHGVTIPDVNAELMIGNGESFFFHGILDDVRFWRSARTLTEIRSSMYRTVDWNESGLTANWRFNENSGLTAYNSIGSLQGTLLNEPHWSTSVPPTGIMTTTRNIPSAGEYQFTGVSFFSVHQSQSAIDTVIVSKFGTPPSGTPPSGITVLHNGYWAVQSTEHGTFSADITFGLGAKSLTLADQEDPGNIKLFRRAVGSTGAWTLAASASSASFGSVTFTGITEYGEFTIGSTTSSHLSGTGGVFQSAASGTWSDGASWFLIGGTDDDGIPDGDDDVTIRAGDEIQLTSSSYVNNLLLLGASTGTRLTVSDNIGLYLYGTLNSDGTVLSPVLIKTGANASVNYHGSGRQIVGNHWSGDVAGWTVNISMSDTARIMTHFKAGALGVNSPTRIGTLDSPKDLFIDGGTENSGTLSVNGSDLFVSGNITRNGTYTSKFASFTASWSTIEIGGTYLSADQIKIGWPDYWYAITNTLRIRSVSGLLINATTYGHMGTLEYVGTGAQTSGNELIGISNIRIKNPFGVQFLSSITVTNLYLDSAGISLGTDVSLSLNNFYGKTYSITGAGNVSISERVETAHADGLSGSFQNTGTVSLKGWTETIVFNGTVPQQSGNLRSYFDDFPNQYNAFIVDNPAGVHFLGSYYGNTLTLTNGNVVLNAPDTLRFNSLVSGTNEIHGSGMYVQKMGSLTTAHANGIDGTIQTTNYAFETPANGGMTFNGSVPQSGGSRMPDSLGGLTIQNSNGFTISRSLYLPSFDLNSQSCNVTIPAGVTFRTGSFGGGAVRTLSGAGNFQLTKGGYFSTQHPSGVNGTLQLTGDVSLGDSASFSFGEASGPQVTGSFLPDTVHSINFSNSAGTTISKPLQVRSSFGFQNGTIDNSSHNITMWDGAVLYRSGGGSIAVTPGFRSFYDVNYNGGAVTTGPEIPDSSTVLRDLLGGNWITLNKDVSVNGNVGTHIRTDSFTVTVSGNVSPYMIVGHLKRTVSALKDYVWEVSDKDAQRYHPFKLHPVSFVDTGSVTVTLYDTAVASIDSLPSNQKVLRYYYDTEQQEISGLSGSITLTYSDADVNNAGIPDDDSLKVMQWKNGSWQSLNIISRDKNNNTITAGPVDTLTTFIITGTEMKGIAALSASEIHFGDIVRPLLAYDTLYIKNTGTWPLQMNSINFTDPWTFGGTFSSNMIPIGDSAAFILSFNALHGGTSAKVYLYHNGTAGVDTVTLTGRAVFPELSFSTQYPQFGTVPVGESKKDSVVLYNTGTYRLILTELLYSSPHFTAVLDADTIEAKDSGKIIINFTPQTEGTFNEWIAIRNSIYNSGDGFRIYPSGIATASQFAAQPSLLSFGSVHRGSSVKDSVLIRNSGAAVLHVSNVSASVAGYTVVPNSFDVPPGDSLWVSVTFSPSSQGDHSGELIFNHSAATTTPDSVHLSGTGLERIFSANKSALSFGSVAVGNLRSDSVTVTNTGNIALNIASVVSTDTTQFTVSPVTAMLGAGAQQTFIITFTPRLMGTQNGTVKFTHNGTPDSNSISVTGFGQVPILSASRRTIDFGEVRIDSVRRDTITISNTGNSSLAVTAVASTDSQFTVSPHSVILSAGAKKEFTVTFAPARPEGSKSASLIFTHNGSPSTDTLMVLGQSVEPLFAATDSLVFGRIRKGTIRTDTVTVTNTGSMPLTVGSVSVSSNIFSVSPSSVVIPKNGNHDFLVTVSSSVTGVIGGSIVFHHDGRTSADSISIVGESVEPIFLPHSTKLLFDSVRVNTVSAESLWVSNPGSMDLTISSVAATDAHFTVAPASSLIAPNDSVRFILLLKPTARGTVSASLVFAHDADSSPDSLLAEGIGVEPLLVASVTDVNFGNVRVDSSAVDSIQISNPGNQLLQLTVQQPADNTFSVDPGTIAIPAGNAKKIAVTFSPKGMGDHTATFILVSNADSSPDTIALAGNGVSPVFSLDRQSVNFGGQPVGCMATDSVRVKNIGTAPLMILSAVSNDTVRYSVSPVTAVIMPSDSLWFRINFRTTEMTERPAVIRFVHDAETGKDSVSVTGHGLMPVLSISSRSVSFGEVRIGNSRLDSLELGNTGNASLKMSSIQLDDPQFIAPVDTFTLQPNETRRMKLKFSPTFRGAVHSKILLHHTASADPDTVTMTGTGIEPIFALNRTEIDFGMMEKESVRFDSVKVANNGNASLMIDSVIVTDSMMTVLPKSAQIMAGDSLTFIFSIRPTATGQLDGTVKFRHNAPAAADTVHFTVKVGPPLFAVDRRTIKFRTTLAGRQRSDTVTITNDGSFDLSISSIESSDSVFQSAPTPVTVKPGTTLRLPVTYSPKRAGTLNGSLVFHHNAATKRDTITLFGSAVELVNIAQARTFTSGTETVIEGTITRTKGMISFIQDTTAGLSLSSQQKWWGDSLTSGGIVAGDIVRVGGTISEMNYQKQFTVNDTIEFTRVSRKAPLPAANALTLAQLAKGAEGYESKVVTLRNVSIVNTTDTVFAAASSYSIVDRTDSSKSVMLRIGPSEETDLVGRKLPKKDFHFTGILAQSHLSDSGKGYHLLPLLASDLESDPTTVKEWAIGIPTEYILYNNFPNPFNPSTTIRFGVPEASSVRLEVFDILGRKVTELFNGNLEAGYQQVVWRANAASGIYLCRIESRSVSDPNKIFVHVKKMMLLK